MGLVVAVDNALFLFFTKISHRFYRLTGRTNFFLAKLAVCVMLIYTTAIVFSYWFPTMLGFRPWLFNVVVNSFISLTCLIDMILCDKAEESIFNDERVRIFHPLHYSPSNRILWVFIALVALLLMPLGRANLISHVLTFLFPSAIVAFKYFVSVDPPTLGKSKIREWIESFSAGFRKLAPIRTKN